MTQTWDAWGGSWSYSWGYSWGWTDASGKPLGGDDAPGLGEKWTKKAKRKQEELFERQRREKLALRETIESAIDPMRAKAKAAAIVRDGDTVQVVPDTGAAVSITVPPAFDAKTVAREVAAVLERARIEAKQAAAMAQAERFLGMAREQIAARIRRRQLQQYILLMTD